MLIIKLYSYFLVKEISTGLASAGERGIPDSQFASNRAPGLICYSLGFEIPYKARSLPFATGLCQYCADLY